MFVTLLLQIKLVGHLRTQHYWVLGFWNCTPFITIGVHRTMEINGKPPFSLFFFIQHTNVMVDSGDTPEHLE